MSINSLIALSTNMVNTTATAAHCVEYFNELRNRLRMSPEDRSQEMLNSLQNIWSSFCARNVVVVRLEGSARYRGGFLTDEPWLTNGDPTPTPDQYPQTSHEIMEYRTLYANTLSNTDFIEAFNNLTSLATKYRFINFMFLEMRYPWEGRLEYIDTANFVRTANLTPEEFQHAFNMSANNLHFPRTDRLVQECIAANAPLDGDHLLKYFYAMEEESIRRMTMIPAEQMVEEMIYATEYHDGTQNGYLRALGTAQPAIVKLIEHARAGLLEDISPKEEVSELWN